MIHPNKINHEFRASSHEARNINMGTAGGPIRNKKPVTSCLLRISYANSVSGHLDGSLTLFLALYYLAKVRSYGATSIVTKNSNLGHIVEHKFVAHDIFLAVFLGHATCFVCTVGKVPENSCLTLPLVCNLCVTIIMGHVLVFLLCCVCMPMRQAVHY